MQREGSDDSFNVFENPRKPLVNVSVRLYLFLVVLTLFSSDTHVPFKEASNFQSIPEHMVPVLLNLAVSTMKSGWDKISSESTKSESSIARINSVSHYGLPSRKTCQILGTNTAHVKNAHIWPHNNRDAMILVELKPSDIDDPRNILRLHENIAYYLDRFHLTLVSSGTDVVLKVLDTRILP